MNYHGLLKEINVFEYWIKMKISNQISELVLLPHGFSLLNEIDCAGRMDVLGS
jgi:hypothetical protein